MQLALRQHDPDQAIVALTPQSHVSRFGCWRNAVRAREPGAGRSSSYCRRVRRQGNAGLRQKHANMISTQDFAHSDRSHLIAVARADRSELTPERRSELDELLASAEPPYDHDPSRWDPAIYFALNARVAANAWARAGCWKEAWQVMAGAVPDDPMHATEVAELRLLEILLSTLHPGDEVVDRSLVRDVDQTIRRRQK